MSPVFIGRHTGAERMPNRIDEVLLDPRDKSVPDPGEAAKLFAALPEEINPPKHVRLERWHSRRAIRPADSSMWHGASDVVPQSSSQKLKLLFQDTRFVRQRNDNYFTNVN
jgi:hypothetical protein